MHISHDVTIIAKWFEKSGFDKLFTTEVKKYVEVHTFLNKELLSKEGSPLPYLFYLVSGKAKIYMTHENGRRSLVHQKLQSTSTSAIDTSCIPCKIL